jgi:hypothetical protein
MLGMGWGVFLYMTSALLSATFGRGMFELARVSTHVLVALVATALIFYNRPPKKPENRYFDRKRRYWWGIGMASCVGIAVVQSFTSNFP